MSTIEYPSQSQNIVHIIEEIDRLIAEMIALRVQVSALSKPSVRSDRSVREAEYVGMWADREDMRGLSSREWLERLRAQQWTRQ
jgi:dsDNA-specific endonuclease/ATPase MutS2